MSETTVRRRRPRGGGRDLVRCGEEPVRGLGVARLRSWREADPAQGLRQD